MMRGLGRCLACVVILGAIPSGWAQSGYTELRVSGAFGVEGKPWQLVERWRPRFTADVSERITLFTELEVAFTQGRRLPDEVRRIVESSDFGPLVSDAGIAWPESTNATLGIDGVHDYIDVPRLYVDWYREGFDIRIGRQSVYWGSAALLNPTDPFPELLIAEPWRPRRGMNAVRVLIPIGDVSDFTTVFGTNDTWTTLRASSRLRTTFALADASLVAAYRGDDKNGFVGFDLRGTQVVGYWLEAALWSEEWQTVDLAVGVDYSFDDVLSGMTWMVQYFLNGRGRDATTDLGLASVGFGDAFPSEDFEGSDEAEIFGPLLEGRHYALSAVTVSVSLDTTVGMTTLLNLKDKTGVIVPTLSIRATDWSEISLTAEIPFALDPTGGEFYPTDESLVYSRSFDDSAEPLEVDFSGLRSEMTATLWVRMSY